MSDNPTSKTESFRQIERLEVPDKAIAGVSFGGQAVIVHAGLLNVDEAHQFRDWLNRVLPPDETNGVTDEQAFTAAAVRALRGHRWCGDQYPENGWPDINTALALYAKLGRSPLEPSPEPCKHGHTNQGCRECFPLKASETPQHDFRGPTVSCRCGWIGHPNALIGLTCPKCSAEFK